MKDRIHQLMESLHMTQKTFAEFLGISPASLSSIFNGRTNPSTGITMAIRSKIPDISLDWLMFGEGSMYKSAPQESQNALNSEVSAPEKVPSDLFEMSQTPQQSVSVPQVTAVKVVPQVKDVKNLDKPSRKITEIRVFFDDLTYESFVPKK